MQFIREKGHLYTDRQLAEMIQQQFNVEIDWHKILNIRKKLGIFKLPSYLRPAFGGKRYRRNNNAKYNIETIREVCEAILHEANGSKEICIRARRLRPLGITSGKASYAFAYLRNRGIATKASKHVTIKWKINVRRLKKEVEKLKNGIKKDICRDSR